MKLQLKGTLPTKFATLAGTRIHPTTEEGVVEDTGKVLDVFVAQGHDPVTRRDVQAVLSEMGYSEEELKEEWKAIADTIGDRTEKVKHINGKKVRGYYGLGVEKPEPTSTNLDEVEGVELVQKQGLQWAPEVSTGIEEAAPETTEAPTMTEDELYRVDPGLRQMAIEQTPCFGLSYRKDSDPCGTCLLRAWCSSATLSRMRDVAEELDREFQEQVASLNKPEEPEEEAPGESEASGEGAPAPATEDGSIESIASQLRAKLGEDSVSILDLPFEGVCSGCDETVTKGVKMIHILNVGMLHPGCALATQS